MSSAQAIAIGRIGMYRVLLVSFDTRTNISDVQRCWKEAAKSACRHLLRGKKGVMMGHYLVRTAKHLREIGAAIGQRMDCSTMRPIVMRRSQNVSLVETAAGIVSPRLRHAMHAHISQIKSNFDFSNWDTLSMSLAFVVKTKGYHPFIHLGDDIEQAMSDHEGDDDNDNVDGDESEADDRNDDAHDHSCMFMATSSVRGHGDSEIGSLSDHDVTIHPSTDDGIVSRSDSGSFITLAPSTDDDVGSGSDSGSFITVAPSTDDEIVPDSTIPLGPSTSEDDVSDGDSVSEIEMGISSREDHALDGDYGSDTNLKSSVEGWNDVNASKGSTASSEEKSSSSEQDDEGDQGSANEEYMAVDELESVPNDSESEGDGSDPLGSMSGHERNFNAGELRRFLVSANHKFGNFALERKPKRFANLDAPVTRVAGVSGYNPYHFGAEQDILFQKLKPLTTCLASLISAAFSTHQTGAKRRAVIDKRKRDVEDSHTAYLLARRGRGQEFVVVTRWSAAVAAGKLNDTDVARLATNHAGELSRWSIDDLLLPSGVLVPAAQFNGYLRGCISVVVRSILRTVEKYQNDRMPFDVAANLQSLRLRLSAVLTGMSYRPSDASKYVGTVDHLGRLLDGVSLPSAYVRRDILFAFHCTPDGMTQLRLALSHDADVNGETAWDACMNISTAEDLYMAVKRISENGRINWMVGLVKPRQGIIRASLRPFSRTDCYLAYCACMAMSHPLYVHDTVPTRHLWQSESLALLALVEDCASFIMSSLSSRMSFARCPTQDQRVSLKENVRNLFRDYSGSLGDLEAVKNIATSLGGLRVIVLQGSFTTLATIVHPKGGQIVWDKQGRTNGYTLPVLLELSKRADVQAQSIIAVSTSHHIDAARRRESLIDVLGSRFGELTTLVLPSFTSSVMGTDWGKESIVFVEWTKSCPEETFRRSQLTIQDLRRQQASEFVNEIQDIDRVEQEGRQIHPVGALDEERVCDEFFERPRVKDLLSDASQLMRTLVMRRQQRVWPSFGTSFEDELDNYVVPDIDSPSPMGKIYRFFTKWVIRIIKDEARRQTLQVGPEELMQSSTRLLACILVSVQTQQWVTEGRISPQLRQHIVSKKIAKTHQWIQHTAKRNRPILNIATCWMRSPHVTKDTPVRNGDIVWSGCHSVQDIIRSLNL